MLTCSRVRTALRVNRTVAMMEEAFTVGEAVGKPAGCHDGAYYHRLKMGSRSEGRTCVGPSEGGFRGFAAL